MTNPRQREVEAALPGGEVTDNLTAFERRLYAALYAADGAVVTRRELLAVLFGEHANYTVADNADLRSLIYHLRHFKGVEITNVKGVGYMLGNKRCPTCGQVRPR